MLGWAKGFLEEIVGFCGSTYVHEGMAGTWVPSVSNLVLPESKLTLH